MSDDDVLHVAKPQGRKSRTPGEHEEWYLLLDEDADYMMEHGE